MTRIHAVIFSWPKHAEKAHAIFEQVAPHVDQITVIDSSGETVAAEVPKAWLRVDRTLFYGHMFREALKHFDGDVLLQIQADATAEDWGELIATCRRRFQSIPLLGVWAPEVDYTPWALSQVGVCTIGDTGPAVVAQTDGIVTAMTKDIVAFLGRLDYAENNLGWGIDWAANAYAYSAGKLVVRDTTVTIRHPKGTGYDRSQAKIMQKKFLMQLPSPVAVQCRLLMKVCYAGAGPARQP